MLTALLNPIRIAAARAARKAAFGAVGVLLLLVGLAFLTIAAWIALALAYGALVAALVLGLGFCGLGLIFVAFAARRVSPPVAVASRTPHKSAATQGQLIEAFLGGLNAGKSMRRK